MGSPDWSDNHAPPPLRFRPRSVWQELPILALCLSVQITAGTAAVRAHFARANALIDGDWQMTKLDLARPVPGTLAFARDRQALATGAVNLRVWHGFHELVHQTAVPDLTSLELDLFLGSNAWVAAILRGADPAANTLAIRFSLNDAFPSAILEVTPEGQFVSRQTFTPALEIKSWYRARLELDGAVAHLLIDGHEVAQFDHRLTGPYRFGIRGGRMAAFVDNVVASGPGGSVVERFERAEETRRATTVLAMVLVVANLLAFWSLRRHHRAGDPPVSFRLLMVSLTVLAVVAVAAWFSRRQATLYPAVGPQLAAAEQQHRQVDAEHRSRQLGELYPERLAADRYRILFVGSSQTWGQGATRESDVVTVVLERLLNVGGRADYECINTGIPSARAVNLAPLLGEWLPTLKPRIVLINLGTNDRYSEGDEFATNVGAMVAAIRAAGAEPVFVKEANAWALGHGPLELRHGELDTIGVELSVPVIDMHGYLTARQDDGFLWWDKVHLSSLGQRLMAEHLLVSLRRLGLV